MPDITMCQGGDCPMKDRCYRFTATPDTMQSYFFVPPWKNSVANKLFYCDYFIHNKNKNIKGNKMLIAPTQENLVVIYDGYGRVQYNPYDITFAPKASTTQNETHASLILIRDTIGKDYDSFRLEFDGKTIKQLRKNTPPNTWETLWAISDFKYTDNDYEDEQGNYFVHKTNGVEMGKFEGMEQTYFFTETRNKCKIGQLYHYTFEMIKGVYSFYINDKLITKYPKKASDTLPLHNTGGIGFYTEDAKVLVQNIYFTGIEKE